MCFTDVTPVTRSSNLAVRVVDVYVPPGHNGEGLLLLVDPVGFTGSGLSRTHHMRDAAIKAAPEVPCWPRQCP